MLQRAKILFEYPDNSIIVTRNIHLNYNNVYIYDELNYQYLYQAWKITDSFEKPENKYKYKLMNQFSTKWTNITENINITLLEIEYYCDICNVILPNIGDLRPYKCNICYDIICSNCDPYPQRCINCDNIICNQHELIECETCNIHYCEKCNQCDPCERYKREIS